MCYNINDKFELTDDQNYCLNLNSGTISITSLKIAIM